MSIDYSIQTSGNQIILIKKIIILIKENNKSTQKIESVVLLLNTRIEYLALVKMQKFICLLKKEIHKHSSVALGWNTPSTKICSLGANVMQMK